jgi:hypothetical protein
MSPITFEQFLKLITGYNQAVWPMQIVAYILGIAALFFAIKETKYSSRIVSAILAFFWLWVGIVFNLMHVSKIWKPNIVSGILLIIQAILFLIFGVFKSKIPFRFKLDVYGAIGIIFIVYAIIGYPIIEYFIGRSYTQFLYIGVLPSSTIVFTFGLFLWMANKLPKYLLIIPFIFAIDGILVIPLGVYEDIGMLIAGLLGTIMILYRDRKKKAKKK